MAFTPFIELYATKSSQTQLMCEVTINGESIPAIIDLRATGNFMCSTTVEWDAVST
jgi:hypothetical protein